MLFLQLMKYITQNIYLLINKALYTELYEYNLKLRHPRCVRCNKDIHLTHEHGDFSLGLKKLHTPP
jgi:NAD-dependent SIR2 family protein deacetylase